MEREFIKTAEVVGKGLQLAQKIGSTLLEPFRGGWTDLGKIKEQPPQSANITVYESDQDSTTV